MILDRADSANDCNRVDGHLTHHPTSTVDDGSAALAVLSSYAFNTETAVLLSSLFSHDGEYSGLVQITLQRLHGRSEFALGNAVIILSVIVQYLPINVTL